MSKIPLTKDDVEKHKTATLHRLENLLDTYINDSKPEHLKKASLIEYWLDNYITYIEREESFSPSDLKRYERGDIIKVNFGFNIGSEYGGLHYAIVLDKQNKHNCPVVTVIPLTSYTEGDEIHEDDIFLGHELFTMLNAKIKGLKQQLASELQNLSDMELSLNTLLDFLKPILSEIAATSEVTSELESKVIENKEQISRAQENLINIKKQRSQIQKQEKILNKASLEIAKMKSGSVALVNQITTISKQRIYDPKGVSDVLHGIKLSPDGLDKLNDGLRKLFIK